MSNILLACVHRVFPLFCCATYKEALDRLLLLQQENEVSSWYMFSKSWRIISSAATFFPENCVFFCVHRLRKIEGFGVSAADDKHFVCLALTGSETVYGSEIAYQRK